MARVIILGTSGAVCDARHDYTHFLLIGKEDGPVLVDAGSNPLEKIKRLGIDHLTLGDIILTHFHSDHVAGVPNMLMHMWQMGRKQPIQFYGIPHCIDRVEGTMDMYGWEYWPNFFPVSFTRTGLADDTLLFENHDFLIRSFPVVHFIPTIGMRITNKHNGKVLAYSCDTEPCPNALKIGKDADIFIHEAAGPPPGHSTARMAGEAATQASAKQLRLIHYQVWNQDPEALVAEAAQTYDGPITLCRDFDEFEF
ncbi:MAG: MBL fold metallo-hydrolase [Chloroflexi bacterium]|nr:MBL fold metallo-hydrolase [Chloroflexota bacterium]